MFYSFFKFRARSVYYLLSRIRVDAKSKFLLSQETRRPAAVLIICPSVSRAQPISKNPLRPVEKKN